MNRWSYEILERVPGEKIRCRGSLPVEMELFKDHFPDFPVLPGVLALDLLKQSIEVCTEGEQARSSRLRLRQVSQAKFQVFLRPGDAWESTACFVPDSQMGSWNVKLMAQGRSAVSARMFFYDLTGKA